MQAVSSTNSTSTNQASYSDKSYKSRNADKAATATVATDSYVPSGKTPVAADSTGSVASEKSKNALDGFDIKAFRAKIHDQLLSQINQAKDQIQKSGGDTKWINDVLYAVSPDEKPAAVPDEYSAENTSQRIVDFAMSFRSQASNVSDEDFIKQIRDAIDQGFHMAKDDLGNLPGPVAKLFNDTYEATMKKLDQALADMKSVKESGNTTVAAATEATVDASIIAGATPASDAKSQDVATNNVEASKAASAYQNHSRWNYSAVA